MPKRTEKQIKAEIKALEACKSYIPHRTMFGDNHWKVELQIKYLRGEIDITDNKEWDNYNSDDQASILEAQSWEEGDSDKSLSSDWDDYKPDIKKKK